MRPSDENCSGGTLSGVKIDVYIFLKICKLMFGVSITSFLLKFAIDRALGKCSLKYQSKKWYILNKIQSHALFNPF